MNFPALFDLSDRAQIELRGSDRSTFLNNFCTNDVKKLQPGAGCEAFLSNIKGRILGHIMVSATEESLWLDSVPGSNEFITSHLEKYLITEDVEIVDRTAEVGPLCLIGPEIANWLAERGCDVSDLSIWGQRPAMIEGINVIVRHVGFATVPAFELVVAHNQTEKLSAAITGSGINQGSAEEFDAVRIDAGFPHYGIDITEENIAQESGRSEQAISFTKGCYLGQEPIARLDALGHTNKELRILRFTSGPVPERGAGVRSLSGEHVGQITSAATSPGTRNPVSLAMLKTAVISPGTEVMVGDERVLVSAAIVPS